MTTISKTVEELYEMFDNDEISEDELNENLRVLAYEEEQAEIDAYYSHAEAIHDAMHDEGLCA